MKQGQDGLARSTLGDLLALALPHKEAISAALALGILGSVAALAQPLAVGSVLGAVRTGSSVVGPAALLILLFAADATLSGVQGYLAGRTGEGIVLDLRRTLIGRLVRMRIPEHDLHRTGDLISRVGADTTLLKTALVQSLTNAVVGALTFLGALVLMVTIDPVLLSATLLCVLLATAVVLAVASRMRKATEEAQRRVGTLSAALERALRAIRTVKISRAEEREEEAISGEALSAYRAGVRAAKLEALVGPATNVALQGSFVLVLGIGGARLASGALSLEDLVAFLLYLLYLVMPLVLVFVSFAELQQGLAAVNRLQEILAAPVEESTVASQSIPHRGGAGSARQPGARVPIVGFEAVDFAYAPGRPVLRGASMEIFGPGLTALVGPSGAGKSTIFALMERFYDVDSGRILFEGTDIRGLSLGGLRSRIGYVEQDAPVMAGSVRENLLYANPDASGGELEDVLELTNLRPMVEQLPKGLDEEVGEGGRFLSGGERQRIAIARALLARPRLLLLDEVTSQLDAANELALRDTISRVSERCTVLVIAHRLSTVRGADKILVLDGGTVRAAGTHEELVSSDALYRKLASTQLIGAEVRVD